MRDLEFEVRHVRNTLYQVEESCYLIAVSHDEQLQVFDDTKFVTCLLWAEGEGAALRSTLQEIENDRIIPAKKPPREMLLPNGSATYGAIIGTLKSNQRRQVMEVASYRIARDGAFIHRAIHAPKLDFYFRGLTEESSERPYAILRYLRDSTSATRHGRS